MRRKNMVELIPSKDTRKYLEAINHQFTDYEKATLIYNNEFASIPEKEIELVKLKEITLDKRLIKQIDECFKCHNELVEAFKYNDNNYIYVLNIWDEDSSDYIENGYFSSYEIAIEYGSSGEKFYLSKQRIISDDSKQDYEGTLVSELYFDNKNQLQNMWSNKIKQNDFEQFTPKRFECAYVRIPYPFRQEDIVRIVGTDKIGIVIGSDEDAKKNDQLMNSMDSSEYGDCQVQVDTYFDGDAYLSDFSHEHVNPINLEYANLEDNDVRKGFLEYMKGTLFQTSMFFGPGRSAKRIQAVLVQVEKLWMKYPDLRLGQLLLNCLESTPLFAIEDEMLMEKIQKFIDR
jgi:hypothetical protein